ncbi:MAG: 16S rRNA (adenine(1518)-N(6)/adenine(1519)-N(6))-dimethyltransferase RsmA [Elusimicrobiota bacterium]
MKAHFGQNFLVDRNIARKIVNSANVLTSDTIIEIGPGHGILTDDLKNKSDEIIAVEIDKKLVLKLSEKYKNQKNIKIINEDFLKYNLPEKQKLKFIGNLPYCVSCAIIFKILSLSNWDIAVFMVQKEVAKRIKSQLNSSDYGVLAIACQVKCSVEKIFDVPNTCFNPMPKVTSTVIRLKRLKKPLIEENEEKNFFRIVKSSFLYRRKTILNSLSLTFPVDTFHKKFLEEKIIQAGILPNSRAGTISIDDFIRLSKILV